MTTFRSFEEIDSWQESRVLVRTVRSVCKREIVSRDYAFVDQITRAALSVSANIAEGCEARTKPQFIEFLGYAKRSAGEVRSHLYDALDEGYITKQEFSKIVNQARKVISMIAKLIVYLRGDVRQERLNVQT